MSRRLIIAPPPPKPTAYEVIDALEAARQLLRPGLAKGSAHAVVDGIPCFCIVAAITAASRTKQIRDLAMDAARRALPGTWAWKGTLEQYNDAPTTSVEDAKTLLQRAKGNVREVAA
ncbi:DUF6197 family protein [Mycobacterium asiaticum]|uniref:DUF6197 family protein n=1 Tax=Mycobacterium asiaticum TaxID=1790 RepID=UPI0007EF9051|nr:hypothetical protein [Mycobacterium asiaticum]OBJ65950.1 hypothetical protein A9W94_07725 [Mycobacterium asiaticum]